MIVPAIYPLIGTMRPNSFVFSDVTLAECVDFLFVSAEFVTNRTAVCRQLLNMGFTGKQLKYRYKDIDVDDCVSFWCNLPTHVIRPGVRGVYYQDLVDIDESGYYVSASHRRVGHSLELTPAVKSGGPQRVPPHYSTLIAVDAWQIYNIMAVRQVKFFTLSLLIYCYLP